MIKSYTNNKTVFSAGNNSFASKTNTLPLTDVIKQYKGIATVEGRDPGRADIVEAISNYDINKMMAVDSAWRKRSAEVGNDIDELYNEMMKKYYDKTIFINKLTKSEWLNNDNMMKRDHDAILSDDNIHERVEGFRFLESYQKKCGYQSGIFL